MSVPELSVVVVAYDIPRELPRTLTSLSPGYQLHIDADDYEVIVVDNGSCPPVDLKGAADNVRLIRIDDARPSPAEALNRGLAAARGEIIAVMIDGARLASPGLLHFGRQAALLYEQTVVASLGWYLGYGYQRFAAVFGHDAAAEDALLESIDWPADGYRLFEIATMDESSVDGWFPPLAESNCLFLKRESWDQLQGFDERFAMPGGGLLNLDTFRRALALPQAELAILLGDGTFHQHHGGTATGLAIDAFAGAWDVWAAEYESIRGEPYDTPRPQRPPSYLGTLPPPVLERLARAVTHPAKSPAPLGEGFDPVRWTAKPSSPPADPVRAGLIDLAHRYLFTDRLAAAAEVVRLARAHAPDDPELQRLGALLAPFSAGDPAGARSVESHIALGDAHRLLANHDEAVTEYQAALALEPDLPWAHVGLAHLALPGEFYLAWLERIYAFLQPESILELGVAEGRSLATVQRPTVVIGVDPLASAMVPVSADAHIFRETSDEFFDARRLENLLDGPLGVAFIDGGHTYEQALKDFVNVERHCGPRSLVMVHDTLPLDPATQSRARDTTFHTGDVWKLVLCLKQLRPELDVITIATPWTGLTLISGFAEGDPGLAAGYEEAVARFIDTPYAALGDEIRTKLNVVPNDWAVVRPRIEHLRSVTDEDDAEPRSGSLDVAHHADAYIAAASRELLQRTHEELIHTQQQYQRVEGELLAADEHARELAVALNNANASLRRVEQSVTWQAFQRLRGRVFALSGGVDSRVVRTIQRTLRRLGRSS